MPKTSKIDAYSSRIISSVTMSGANALTFVSVDFGISIFQKLGILVNRIEVLPSGAAIAELSAALDTFAWGLVNNQDLTNIYADDDPRIYLSGKLAAIGAATNSVSVPIVYDFSTFPNGGLLIPPRPLYWGLDTTGFVAAAQGYFRLWYQMIELTDVEYIELVQSVIGAAL